MLLKFEGDLIPWRSHRGYGKTAFNPLYAEKKMVQWLIREQLAEQEIELICEPVRIDYVFKMKMPKNGSQKKKINMLSGLIRPTKRPDITNLIKFYEDCLKEIIIIDDSYVVECTAKKIYGQKPSVELTIEKIL